MKTDANYWVNTLQLDKHIEGGFYKEVYRSPITAGKEFLPASFNGDTSFCTSIYFLLEHDQFSAFHRIASDEIWHFYAGNTLIIYEMEIGGDVIEHRLGNGRGKGEVFQTVIRAGNWFASRPAKGSDYSLVGCTVSPGFDFADFKLAERSEMILQYPQHAGLITSLTR
jgi:predicted cupin superfamily sugar epimerase